ncbi:cancer-related nucleoside-triphosphatase homolog [Schistocerca americana]|uniref:cancer-related nucleoside-triphosphatase homolog n=1 Tax=Schistocerca americana TaxID=7009 RepID=UPI001F4F621D|nr:cancer-related nucleoside-triphosphatase homolog [Schistocerca americana]
MTSFVGDEIKHVLLTGRPGIGKTTLIKKIYDSLKVKGVEAKGFFTEEVCESGRRIGFDIVALDGRRGELARVRGKQIERSHPEYCVGQYIVNVKSFEAVALPVFCDVGRPGHVLVVDEIGKMELFSKKFKDCVSAAFSSPKATILGTIPIAKQRPIQFVEELRTRPDVKVITVDYNNRNGLENEISEMLISALKTVH